MWKSLLLVVFFIVATGCSKSLDRAQAKAIIESRPWGEDQPVLFTPEQVSCGVTAGLWVFKDARASPVVHWEPTPAGKQLGLVTMRPDGEGGVSYEFFKAGFSVSANVTGLALSAVDAGRAQVEATLSAKIPHECFSGGVPFKARGGGVAPPFTFTFTRFDDGWRITN